LSIEEHRLTLADSIFAEASPQWSYSFPMARAELPHIGDRPPGIFHWPMPVLLVAEIYQLRAARFSFQGLSFSANTLQMKCWLDYTVLI
jgi:hypothetical protein